MTLCLRPNFMSTYVFFVIVKTDCETDGSFTALLVTLCDQAGVISRYYL